MQLINSKAIREVRTKEKIKNNELIRFVQYAKQPMKAFKHILSMVNTVMFMKTISIF